MHARALAGGASNPNKAMAEDELADYVIDCFQKVLCVREASHVPSRIRILHAPLRTRLR